MQNLADESIYNLLPPARQRPQRRGLNEMMSTSHATATAIAPSYSTFPSQTLAGDAAGASLFQGPGANMGRLVGETIDPRKFLKKACGNGGGPAGTRRTILMEGSLIAAAGSANSQKSTSSSSAKPKNRSLLGGTTGAGAGATESSPNNNTNNNNNNNHSRINNPRLPQIPDRHNKPVMGLQTDKNFVHANAVEAMCTAPRRLKKDEPRPTEHADFARVPSYLSSIKHQIQQEQDDVSMVHEYRTQQNAQQKAQYVRQMPEEEREYLSVGLRQVWADKYRQYQALPFAKDTALQVSRKENLERELKEVEADLEKLERPVLYIHRDDTIGVAQYAKAQAQIEGERTAKRMVKEAIISGSTKK